MNRWQHGGMSTGSALPDDQDEARVLDLCRSLIAEVPPEDTDPVTFLGQQFDLGLAWVHFPLGMGGLGLSPKLQRLVSQTLHAVRAPTSSGRNFIGHGMGAPTVQTHGTPAQKSRLLRPLFTGEEIWCQLFSEPGAGSDVAGLATRAVREGDEWVVNGQKVWTTFGHVATWGLLVARTDPDVPKHNGLTYFVLDMHSPGVDVRPLYQMTGEAEFNEVYLSDVRLPDSARLGDIGDGWRVVLTTLMNERVSVGGGIPKRGSGPIAKALALWTEHGASDVVRKDELMRLWIRAEVLRLINLRASQMRAAGNPGPEGSIGKALSAGLNQDVSEFTVDLLGAAGMLQPGGYPKRRPEQAGGSWGVPQQAFLRMRANSIEGGTSEIAKNILGERILGLPGEVRADKGLAWSAVPRS
jgi:alkylation response protein AidB-like acyl-CoA dehydrogenase